MIFYCFCLRKHSNRLVTLCCNVMFCAVMRCSVLRN
nr:MAG TPA: hypothetical protein [Caudoviricetes sp.]